MTQKETGFRGLKVVSFESRMAAEMQTLITRFGGEAVVAPSMQEIPIPESSEIVDFGEKLLSGQMDMLICMTGVGTKMLFETLSARYGRERVLPAIMKLTIVARGPKPLQVLRAAGITGAISVPEPNTSEDILETLDSHSRADSLKHKTVAVQEYGASSERLIRELRKRDARVLQLPVYRWALPKDIEPLKRAVCMIARGEAQISIYTNAVQIRHACRVASQEGIEKEFREAQKNCVVASIGPTCTEALLEEGIHADFEPTHPKMGQLVKELSEQSDQLLQQKKAPLILFADVHRTGETAAAKTQRCRDAVFLKACRREPVNRIPVWLMRQAGRYMKDYRKIRSRYSFLELCKNKEVAAEVTIAAQRKIDADAAIIFSDLLLPVEPLGFGLEYEGGSGPVITGPLKSLSDVAQIPEMDPDASLSFVYDAIKVTRNCLDPMIPLIGFSGAPFTLGAYLIEGGGSKNFVKTKQFMYQDSGAWGALMEKLTRGLASFLKGQIAAGADAVQIFDSWVGCLSPDDYRKYVLPYTADLVRSISGQVPVILFGTGTGPFLPDMCRAGSDVIGIDHHCELNETWKKIGYDRAVQGNLDPAALLAPRNILFEKAGSILNAVGGRPGFIFNLGHGVLPGTSEDQVKGLIQTIHEYPVPKPAKA
ncbi:MAG: uroporphyrinogen decarboxylase [Omnitrophica bacterium GWA2_52_8]|nr:MAG: uroporphyrinogen decarboxylase [Omnitrophica bacterium GWA2_52_8]